MSAREPSAARSPWPHAESSMANPCGTCWRCGGTIYEFLVHHCTTSVRIESIPLSGNAGRMALTSWGTWEWRPW